MFKKLLRSRVTACAVTAVLAVTAVGVGNAIASANSSTIYACKDKQGTLRAIDASGECMKNETPVEWNVEGPAGPQGAAGAQGLPGADGVVRFAVGRTSTHLLPGVLRSEFIGATPVVTVEPGQNVHVWSDRNMGSTAVGGGREIGIDVCWQPAEGGLLRSFRDFNTQVRVPQGTVTPLSLNVIVRHLTGAYRFGLCGWASSAEVAESWNAGSGSTTQVIVSNA